MANISAVCGIEEDIRAQWCYNSLFGSLGKFSLFFRYSYFSSHNPKFVPRDRFHFQWRKATYEHCVTKTAPQFHKEQTLQIYKFLLRFCYKHVRRVQMLEDQKYAIIPSKYICSDFEGFLSGSRDSLSLDFITRWSSKMRTHCTSVIIFSLQ